MVGIVEGVANETLLVVLFHDVENHFFTTAYFD